MISIFDLRWNKKTSCKQSFHKLNITNTYGIVSTLISLRFRVNCGSPYNQSSVNKTKLYYIVNETIKNCIPKFDVAALVILTLLFCLGCATAHTYIVQHSFFIIPAVQYRLHGYTSKFK